MAYVKTNIFGGAFQSSNGAPLSNGWLIFRLSHDESVQLPASQVVGGIPVKVLLDNNGNAVTGQYVWTSDLLNPDSSYYTVEAFNSQGLRVWLAPQYWSLISGSPVDLGTIVPLNP